MCLIVCFRGTLALFSKLHVFCVCVVLGDSCDWLSSVVGSACVVFCYDCTVPLLHLLSVWLWTGADVFTHCIWWVCSSGWCLISFMYGLGLNFSGSGWCLLVECSVYEYVGLGDALFPTSTICFTSVWFWVKPSPLRSIACFLSVWFCVSPALFVLLHVLCVCGSVWRLLFFIYCISSECVVSVWRLIFWFVSMFSWCVVVGDVCSFFHIFHLVLVWSYLWCQRFVVYSLLYECVALGCIIL